MVSKVGPDLIRAVGVQGVVFLPLVMLPVVPESTAE